jgi:Fic family protein
MTSIFTSPSVEPGDQQVIGEIRQIRTDLESVLRAPRRWTGGLRRTTQARAIQGSNTIEGYTITDSDAIAAVEDEEPLSADQRTWAEIIGYRRVLTYVLNVAAQPGFVIDEAALNAMHFMLLEHELSKHPGRYRSTPIYVYDDRTSRNVYEGPAPERVPSLVRELATVLRTDNETEPLIRAAMAHLNLVMIHPYRDGNGRMARALQTLVLAQDAVLEPTFSSIEEWLGHNTEDYYAILAATGRGRWQPGNDTLPWVRFNLRAHHLQAQTLRRRFAEAEQLYQHLDETIARHRLPERVADPLFDALLGSRVTRPSYLRRVEALEDRTATRDLARLTELGLLEPHGQTRGRYYVAAGELADLRDALRRQRAPLADPYPHLMAEIRRTLLVEQISG